MRNVSIFVAVALRRAFRMPLYDLLIPITFPSAQGLFKDAPRQQLFDGHAIEIRIDGTGTYLVVKALEEHCAQVIFDKVTRCLLWAALQMNISVMCENKRFRHGGEMLVDGRFPTLYPAGSNLNLTRATAGFQHQESETLLVQALNEGSRIERLMQPDLERRLQSALEIFASINFESSANARFIGLTTILEMLADPASLRAECTAIIDMVVRQINLQVNAATATTDVVEALADLRKSSQHWRKESFRSSIRRFVFNVFEAFEDADPQSRGRDAVALYDKRSRLVHDGTAVSWPDVVALNEIARKSLAFAAGHTRLIRP
ncbi:hypothetical protein ABID26_001190 [Mesorhizobium shonense]|uniref:Apea-like HEPN domain-containing protein n=1 Tax=Mesorhizobium shonense TaxID=1209948 RepID=A0ABV2HML3_9HYPH